MLRTLSFAYDAAGRWAEASDVDATYGDAYDGLGRLVYQSQALAGSVPRVEDRDQNAEGVPKAGYG